MGMTQEEKYRDALQLIASNFRIETTGQIMRASDYDNWRQEFAIEALRGINPRTGEPYPDLSETERREREILAVIADGPRA